MSSFRFVHAADLHLDSPLIGLSANAEGLAERIQTATRRAFHNLVTAVIEHEASFLLLCGDLYDGDWKDVRTGLYFLTEMGRLRGENIRAYVLYGNHDADNKMTMRLQLPPHVQAFPSKRPTTLTVDDLKVALHGQSFKQAAVTENLASHYPEPLPDCFNIGLLHTGLGGLGGHGHANYAPCVLDQLVEKGYQYWALGHVHQHAILNERPHVVFPGNLQGRHIKEVGPKGACLVSVEDHEVTDVQLIPMDVVRWARVSVSILADDPFDTVVDRIRSAVEQAVETHADGRLLACRIELTGRTASHRELLANADRLLSEARGVAAGIGDELAWIERVIIQTSALIATDVVHARQDAVGELHRILEEGLKDTDVTQQIEGAFTELLAKLPYEVRQQAAGALKAAIEKDYRGLMRQASESLTTELSETPP